MTRAERTNKEISISEELLNLALEEARFKKEERDMAINSIIGGRRC